MKRVLSLLLLIPFLVTQAWALRGGPFENGFGSSQSALSGTYGVSLQGTESAGVDSVSTTGVMALSVPTSGMTMGRILIFDKGLMYFGDTYGRVDPRSGSMKLLSQATHYTFMVTANNPYIAVEGLLSGQLDLQLTRDNITGLIVVSGNATFARYNPLAKTFDQGASTTSTATKNTLATTTGRSGPTTQATQNVTTTETVTTTVQDPDGTTTRTVTTQTTSTDPVSTTTATDTANAATTGTVTRYDVGQLRQDVVVPNVRTTQGSATVALVDEVGLPLGNNGSGLSSATAGLTPGMAVSGPGIPTGATIVSVDGLNNTITLSKPATDSTISTTDKPFIANSSSTIFLTMTADGLREDTQAITLPTLTAPNTGTNMQVGVAPATTGGNTGTTGGAGG